MAFRIRSSHVAVGAAHRHHEIVGAGGSGGVAEKSHPVELFLVVFRGHDGRCFLDALQGAEFAREQHEGHRVVVGPGLDEGVYHGKLPQYGRFGVSTARCSVLPSLPQPGLPP